MELTRDGLKERIQELCLLIGRRFKLSTGDFSDFYFDCKRATLDGQTLCAAADAFLGEIEQLPEQPTAIGGLTLGADPLIAAIILRAFNSGSPIRSGSIVRKERKEHGTESLIENELPPGTPVVVVDDVITKGSSILKACVALKEAGYRVVGIVVMIDRQTGGAERLADSVGCPVRSVFKKSDFPKLVAYERDHARAAAPLAA